MNCLLYLSVFAVTLATADDPSAQPVEDWKGDVGERYRFVEDFDNDGDYDLLLSVPISSFGNAGGSFTLYLRDKDGLTEIGTLSASPTVVSLEHFWSHSKIWVFKRGGGNAGQFGYYKIEEGKLGDFIGIEINPGDVGTDFSNALLDTAFFSSSNRINPELSETINGVVHWEKSTTNRRSQ